MGLYNVLHIEAACRRCGEMIPRALQFKYGECYLHDYGSGDEVRWATGRARRLNMADRAAGRAWLPAYSDSPCPSCGDDAEFADFAVIVDGDRLVGAVSAPVDRRFEEDRLAVPISIGHEPKLFRIRR